MNFVDIFVRRRVLAYLLSAAIILAAVCFTGAYVVRAIHRRSATPTPAPVEPTEKAKEPGKGGEIQLTDAMAMLIGDPGLRGLVIKDAGYDAGQKLDWLRANIELSLADPGVGSEVAAMLADIMKSRGLA